MSVMLRHNYGVSIILFFTYGIVFITGSLGNSFLLIALYRTPSLRTTTNIFIGNLALSDLLVIIFCIPFSLAANLLNEWPFGGFICKLVGYIQAVAVNASVNSLVAISLDRCLSIYRPFGYFLQQKILILSLLFIWIFPMTFMCPWLIVFSVKPAQFDSSHQICSDFWDSKLLADIYFITANLLLSYLLPLFVIIVCYIIIYIKIRTRNIPGELCPYRRRILYNKSKIKIIKMIFIVIITFAISWLPLYVLFCITKFSKHPNTIISENVFQFLFPLAQWLATSNSCINPIIYTCYSRKFRSEFNIIIKKLFAIKVRSNIETRDTFFYFNNHDNNKCTLISSSDINSYI